MSAPHAAPTVPRSPAVPPRARVLAAQLAALFAQDSEIVSALNHAHHRLAGANDRLWSDRPVDPIGVHRQIHSAFCDYQQASEQRRQLAVEVGELAQQLTDALTTVGHSPQHARSANVHELAAGTWRPTQAKETDQ